MFTTTAIAWTSEKMNGVGNLLCEWSADNEDEVPYVMTDDVKAMSLREAPTDVVEGWIEYHMTDDMTGDEPEEEMEKFPERVKAEAQRYVDGGESKFAPNEKIYRYELVFETDDDAVTPDFLFDNLGICILEKFETEEGVPM